MLLLHSMSGYEKETISNHSNTLWLYSVGHCVVIIFMGSFLFPENKFPEGRGSVSPSLYPSVYHSPYPSAWHIISPQWMSDKWTSAYFAWYCGHSVSLSPRPWMLTHLSWLNTSIISLWEVFFVTSPVSPLTILSFVLPMYPEELPQQSWFFNGTVVLQICLSHLSECPWGQRPCIFCVFISGALRSAWFMVGSQPLFDKFIIYQTCGVNSSKDPKQRACQGPWRWSQ